jgi:hypothetical protein
MSFATLGLAEGLLRAVVDEGYAVPTPIQARAIPEILAGRDLLAAAQTGTGKTAAFTLPLLHKLVAHGAPAHRRIRVLVLVPTRELAAQVEQSVRTYGRHLPQVRTALIFGGVSFNPQADHLRRGVDIVVATPGRLLDHAGQRTIDLSHVEVLVLDEADRMLDMGFIHDIRRVIKLLPPKRQNLMFSATFSDDIRSLAHGILRDPVAIDIAPRNSAVHTVAQRMVHVSKNEKPELLSYLIRTGNWRQTLVFARTKRGANKLAERLARDGIATDALGGRVPGRSHARRDHDGGPRGQPPDLSRNRSSRSPPPPHPPPQQRGVDREGDEDQRAPSRALRLFPRALEIDPGRRRLAPRPLHGGLRKRHQRRGQAHPRRPARAAGGEGRRQPQAGPSHHVPEGHPDDEPLPHPPRPHGYSSRVDRGQYRQGRAPERGIGRWHETSAS